MKFIISPFFLLKKISNISKVIIRKPIISSLENFLFEIIDGSLTIVGSDLQNFIISKFSINSNENISVLVPAHILIDTLKILPDKNIIFSIDKDKYIIEIISKNGNYKLLGKNSDEFPNIFIKRSLNTIKISSLILKKIIYNTAIISNNDELKLSVNGINIIMDKIGMTVITTDGYRLVKYFRNDINFYIKKNFIISKRSFLLLNSLLSNISNKIEVEFNNNNIYLKINNIIMVSKLVFEEYLDYQSIIPNKNLYNLNIYSNNLLMSLRRLLIYTNTKTRFIEFRIKKNNLSLVAENLNNNKAIEIIYCKYSGINININFNAKLFIELLSIISSKEIKIFFSISNQACIVQPGKKLKNESLLLLIMPIILT